MFGVLAEVGELHRATVRPPESSGSRHSRTRPGSRAARPRAGCRRSVSKRAAPLIAAEGGDLEPVLVHDSAAGPRRTERRAAQASPTATSGRVIEIRNTGSSTVECGWPRGLVSRARLTIARRDPDGHWTLVQDGRCYGAGVNVMSARPRAAASISSRVQGPGVPAAVSVSRLSSRRVESTSTPAASWMMRMP